MYTAYAYVCVYIHAGMRMCDMSNFAFIGKKNCLTLKHYGMSLKPEGHLSQLKLVSSHSQLMFVMKTG